MERGDREAVGEVPCLGHMRLSRTKGGKCSNTRDFTNPMQNPTFTFEQNAISQNLIPCGIDEAGRGPWAGPVVAAAVILDPNNIPQGLNDSKKLTEAKREALFDPIMQSAIVGVGLADAALIDQINILQATYHAMGEAVAKLHTAPTLALVDGNRAPPLSIRTQTIIGGDAKCLSIAAASIIAKVTRDRMMHALHAQYPHYGFAAHKGYGTAQHADAIQKFGVCPAHRKSYKPVALTISRQFDSRRSPEDS
jgi:ribonuclease HII